MMRASIKGNLKLGHVLIPCAVYVAYDPFGLVTHLYHDGCGTRIRQPFQCPDHPDDIVSSYYNGIDLGDHVLPIALHERNKIMMKDTTVFDVVAELKLTALTKHLSDGSVAPRGLYTLGAMAGNKLIEPDTRLEALRRRLVARKSWLVATMPLHGCLRFCALLAGADGFQLLPLMYQEELRPTDALPAGHIYRSNLIEINKELDALSHELPDLSNNFLTKRIQAWISSMIGNKRKERRYATTG